MKQQEAELLIIAARLLAYPDEKTIPSVNSLINHSVISAEQKNKLDKAISRLEDIPLLDLEKLYVHTFDLKAKTGLYLSAYEFGDSPKRGAALIKLQKIINQAGYERADGELADYIPMLYELVAVMDETDETIRLWKRLGNVTQIILEQLPEDNPYHQLIGLLMEDVFQAPTKTEIKKMEQNREEADLDELPYPIMYN
ncbi:respiratory nitrate reductase chaperone NarJ [Gracilibacillus ureilyticus]|uniref:Respiratory nitrate reductase chaperone NarJ n=1 Tax=Gracilibacillus ureilyticus TaxID=531814 RepID=A0A1H9QVK0_9BACI|nr:nitrate reductase molybdenum cofactor assembly chaperone [Gracilibacillus ureilyticus]SER64265.1 respiratory nitrate reductase chaperone NarJ [Gracilibacillus ureilyticus]